MASEDRALRAWMADQRRKLNDGLVQEGRRLGALLRTERPVAIRRDGQKHLFDGVQLERFARRLSPLVKSEVRVPITFYRPPDDDHTCFVADGSHWEALHQHEESIDDVVDGKAWMYLDKAQALASRYPTLFQFVRL